MTNEEMLDVYENAVGIRDEAGTRTEAKAKADLAEARAAVLARMLKSSPYARCTICSAPLDVPGRPWSRDCGGDCIACMAEVDPDDPDIGPAVAAMRAGEDVVKAARSVLKATRIYSEGGRFAYLNEALLALRDALPAEKGEEG